MRVHDIRGQFMGCDEMSLSWQCHDGPSWQLLALPKQGFMAPTAMVCYEKCNVSAINPCRLALYRINYLTGISSILCPKLESSPAGVNMSHGGAMGGPMALPLTVPPRKVWHIDELTVAWWSMPLHCMGVDEGKAVAVQDTSA